MHNKALHSFEMIMIQFALRRNGMIFYINLTFSKVVSVNFIATIIFIKWNNCINDDLQNYSW